MFIIAQNLVRPPHLRMDEYYVPAVSVIRAAVIAQYDFDLLWKAFQNWFWTKTSQDYYDAF